VPLPPLPPLPPLDDELDELEPPEEPELEDDPPDAPDEPDGFEPPESALPPASEPCGVGVVLPEGSVASGAAGSVGCVVVSAPAPVPVSAEPTAHASRLRPMTSEMLHVAACARTLADNAYCIVAP
jgi:hypothetical protein